MNSRFNAEIDMDEVVAQYEKEKQQAVMKSNNVAFDAKNYLNTRLDPGQNEKIIRIRLLPFSQDGGLPFFKVKTHLVRVNKEVSKGGWKSFICPHHNGYNKPCPYCETAEELRKMMNETTDKNLKEQYSKAEFANRAKDMWVVRCIERGHEEDGVKFWMFSHSKKGNGVYDTIFNIFKTRNESAKRDGETYNIFSLENGKDLDIIIKRTPDNKTTIDVVDSDKRTPLSSDVELANSWISDPKKWTDVFKVKSYDYMSIICEGKVPIYDKEEKKYVAKMSKEEYEEMKQKEIEKTISVPDVKFEQMPSMTAKTEVLTEEDDEELPF